MPEQEPNSKITEPQILVPKSVEVYRPKLTTYLREQFPDQMRLDLGKFDNDMLLVLAGEVPHAVMLFMMNGDNWEEAIVDLFLTHPSTQEMTPAGKNVDRFGIFSPFMDLRQDQPSTKRVPGLTEDKIATVKAQGSWSLAMANMMKYVAGVDYLVQLDGHSHLAATQFEEVGIDVINLTTAFEMINEMDRRGLLNDNLENVICGIDFGNLPLVKAIRERYGFLPAIIKKWREPSDASGKSETSHDLVYGQENVCGNRVILVDDMVSSGGTLIKTVNLLIEAGAAEVLVCAAHAVFSPKNYYEKIRTILANDKVKIVLTTNTLPLKRPKRGEDRSLPYLDMDHLTGKHEVRRMERIDFNPMTAQILEVILDSETNDQLRKDLAEWAVALEDPYDIYEEITGRKEKRPEIVAIYREGNVFEPLPNSE